MPTKRTIKPTNEPEGRRIVYLKERGGTGVHTKEFDTRKQCNKYLGRHHDSVVAYVEHLVNDDGTETFIKKGKFHPRTEQERQRDRAKLRCKRRARQRAKEAAEKEQQALRPTKW